MAGSCIAFVRCMAGTAAVSIPYKFWGLEPGGTYRMVLTFLERPRTQIPYSFDVRLRRSGNNVRASIPKCVPAEIGDQVRIWVGREEDFDKETGWAFGRGNSKEERTQYLEEQADILRRCAREQIHNERVP